MMYCDGMCCGDNQHDDHDYDINNDKYSVDDEHIGDHGDDDDDGGVNMMRCDTMR